MAFVRRSQRRDAAAAAVQTGRGSRCYIAGPVRQDARLIMLPTRVEDGVLTYVYDEIKPKSYSTSLTGSAEEGRMRLNSPAETRGATGEEVSR